MMLSKDSIFYCLYRGGVSPTESNRRPLTGEYKKLLDKADDLQTKVQSLLTDEGKQLLEELQKWTVKSVAHLRKKNSKRLVYC